MKNIKRKITLTIFTIAVFAIIPSFVLAQDFIFTRTLQIGMSGEDVRELQKFLNANNETQIAENGDGSLGNETDYFGRGTQRALIRFQNKYKEEILTPVGLKTGTGFFGEKTREKINLLIELTDTTVATSNVPMQTNPETIAVVQGKPKYIIIPAIHVNALIEHLGVTPQEEMATPKGPTNVAWFDLGPRPGENGSAVIAGHFGWKNNIPAVFDDLQKLQKGDKIYIKDELGVIITFVVRESKRYDPEAESKDVFSSNDKTSHLNLITCEGIWDKKDKSYSDRLVVFTDKI